MKSVRGHRMAKAAIETACWDLEAKRAGAPLWRHLGGVNGEIPCGVSIGIQDSPEQLIEKIEKEVNAEYQRIKIKITARGTIVAPDKPGIGFEVNRERLDRLTIRRN